MQHAERIDEIESLWRERRPIQISLHDLNVADFFRILSRNFNRRPQIYCPNFCAVLGRIVSEATATTPGVQNLLTAKKIRTVRVHVIQEALFPFSVHLGKAGPFIAKTLSGFYLALIGFRSWLPACQGLS